MMPDETTPPTGAACADCGSSLDDGAWRVRQIASADGIPVFDLVCLPCWIVNPSPATREHDDDR